MNHLDIQTFLTIVSSPSLSKAAEALYVSQPALSHRLSALEHEVGAELVVRHRGIRAIELTDAGQRFVPIAKKWEQLWQETQKLSEEQPAAPFRMSNVDSLNLFFMPQVVSGFLKKNPSCRLSLVTMRSNVSYSAVENHEIDLGFITNPHFFKKVQTIPLFRENMAFICGTDANYHDSIDPSALDSADEIYIPWSNPFLMWHDYWFGSSPQLRVALDNMSLLEQLLRLPDAWAIVPATVAQTLSGKGGCRTVPLRDAPEPRTCYAILTDQRHTGPVLTGFIREFQRTAATFPEISVLSPQAFPLD